MPKYLQSLREGILEAYVGLLHGVRECRDTSILDPFVQGIFEYMRRLTTGEAGRNLELLKAIVGLIGDFAMVYGKKLEQLLIADFVTNAIALLDQSNLKVYKETSTFAAKAISSARKK